jgi:hypothetical protein
MVGGVESEGVLEGCADKDGNALIVGAKDGIEL